MAQVLHGLQDLIAFVLDAGAASQQPVHEVEHFVQLLGVLRVDRFVQRLEGDRFRQAENDAVHLVEHPVPGAAHLGVVTTGRGDGGGVLVGVAFRLVGGIGCGIAGGIRRRLGQREGTVRAGDPTALSIAFWAAIQGIAEELAVYPDMPCPEPEWIVDIVRKR